MWKFAQIVMIPKPGKPNNEVTSYRPISLPPILLKIFEKLLVNIISHDAEIHNIVTCFVTEDAVEIVNWFIQQPTNLGYNYL